jgi:hypothetical protein
MACDYCLQPLGCDVDCPNAPWNHDRPRATRMGYLMRLARWWCGDTRNTDRRWIGMTSLRGATLTWGR